MEIVSIERKTFEEMVAKFDRFTRRMDAICQRHGEKTMGKWMDNQDVCQMLNISPSAYVADTAQQWHAGLLADKPQDVLPSRRCAAYSPRC